MRKRAGLSRCLLISCFLAVSSSVVFGGDIIYVNANAGSGGDGQSWATAYDTLQVGINAADPCDDIWVAAGTYYPDPCGLPDAREASFQMVNGVGIYGGFAPTGSPIWQDRDPHTHVTILSGDIGTAGNDTDNCYHVFYHPNGTDLDSTAVLNGVTITRGNASGGSYPHYHGGGMCNYASSPTLTNCTFSENSADYDGGAMLNSASSPTLTDCTFIGNSADVEGGGLCNYSGSPMLTNCVFSGNSADYGAGMCNSSSSSMLTNCTFSRNSAGDCGGGMFNYNSSPTLTNCILWGNTATESPQISSYGSSTPAVTYCCVEGGHSGTDNISSDPLFIDPNGIDNTPGTTDDNLRLQADSLCIDAGDNTPVTETTDLDGNPRITDGDGNGTQTVDIGAYEHEDHYEDGPIIYVKATATGANTGSSWTDAYLELHTALAAADPCNVIWVAAGTYTPDPCGPNDPREASFQMKNNLAVYGGFEGTEDHATFDLDNRNFTANETILSGDLLNNDVPVPDPCDLVSDPCRSDNCYHVFYHPDGLNLNSSAVLDGFTITAANANHVSWQHHYGGGMFNYRSSPTTTNCAFTNNYGKSGGSIYNYDNTPAITDCTFTNNAARNGAGIFNEASFATVINCTFTNNAATGHAGGVLNTSSQTTLAECAFTNNSAVDYGGAIHNSDSDPMITYCAFVNNSANDGAAIHNRTSSSPTITESMFFNNTAGDNGGGIYNHYNSNPLITTCIFENNTAQCGGAICNDEGSPTVTACIFNKNSTTLSGGGIHNSECSPTIIACTFRANSTVVGGAIYNYSAQVNMENCTITANTAFNGGAIANDFYTILILVNCTIAANNAEYDGGGIYNVYCTTTLKNCILWANTALSNPQLYDNNSTILATHSCIQGGTGQSWFDTGCIDTDPIFEQTPNDGGDGWGDDPATPVIDEGANDDYGNLRLQSASPCVDTGDNTPVTQPTDLDGNLRIADGNNDGTHTVDMGAYEYEPQQEPASVVYVDVAATGANTGVSWDDAYLELYNALAASEPGNIIWVAAGTYTPDPCGPNDPREASFQMKNNLAVYGGFVGTEDPAVFDLNDRNFETNETILSGDLLNNDVAVPDPCDLIDDPCRADNCYHVVTVDNIDSNTILDGFTVTAGNANGPVPHDDGAGFHGNSYSYVGISNCVISSNSAFDRGGGLYKCNGQINHCTVTGNSAGESGAGFAFCNGTITSCDVSGNRGIGLYDCDGQITRCKVTDNTSAYDGGGLNYCDGLIANCIITGNAAILRDGGGLYACEGAITGCIVTGNRAYTGGGLSACGGSITNCVVSENRQNYGPELRRCSTALYSCVPSGSYGAGCISSDPCFVNSGYWADNGTPGDDSDDFWVDGDYHLQPQSPCIDTGNYFYCMELPSNDLDGNTRLVGPQIDIGCFEFGGIQDSDGDWLADVSEPGHAGNPDRDNDGLLDGVELLGATNPDVSDPLVEWNLPGDASSIQEALFFARSGESIILSPDTYYENIHIGGRNVVLTGTNPYDAAVVASTIITPDIDDDPITTNGRVMTFRGTENGTCSILGLTLAGGNTDSDGGGIFGYFCQANISNCTITNNSAGTHGGGLYYCNGDITDCLITDNSAEYGGGGLYGCDGQITNCEITNNAATLVYGGGGLSSGDGPITGCLIANNSSNQDGGGLLWCYGPITDCTIIDNSANRFGGGLCGAYGPITGCIFTGNSADSGGGVCMYGTDPEFVNCTFSANSATSGNAIAGDSHNQAYPGSILLTNCILWDGGDEIANNDGSTITIDHSCVQDDVPGDGSVHPGTGNIDTAPLFLSDPNDGGDGWGDDPATPDIDEAVNDDYGNLHLQFDSPCIDAGDNSVVAEATELDGFARIVDGDCDTTATVDMGAYEFDWLYLGDFSGNCNVDLLDFSILSSNWLQDNPAIDIAPSANSDGIIDLKELLILTEHWLEGTLHSSFRLTQDLQKGSEE